jgi:hypothetical protein
MRPSCMPGSLITLRMTIVVGFLAYPDLSEMPKLSKRHNSSPGLASPNQIVFIALLKLNERILSG